ncbi:hypothetical protein [Clostridium sp. UBA2485]|uniref:hypothetical protein n=1 Tax=Clostridium sp. UBA2485 TaxID=1946352 RepID=UPI0025C51F5F|nr:hypothetical protein [Clostridium sp. UBA2485]
MDKSLFRSTERKLYNFYSKDKKINSLKNKIEILEKQIRDIENDLRTCNVNIEEESRSISYEERVQSSGDGCSYAERAIIRATEKQLQDIEKKKYEIEITKGLIRDIELDNSIIEYNIKFLNDESKILLKLKYKDKKKEWQIGQKLNSSQSRVNKMKNDLIKDISNWDSWLS